MEKMKKEIDPNIKKAYSEALVIINNLEPELYSKIPYGLISFFYRNKDNNYVANIDLTKSINEQNLLDETRALLAVIYRDYICSKEKRIKLLKEEEKYFQEKNDKLFDMFSNKDTNAKDHKEDDDIQISENKEITIIKENIYTRIKAFLQKMISRNK